MMLNVYIESAAIERLRCGRPSEGTVKNTRVGLRKFQSWASWVVNPEISTVETEAKTPLHRILSFLEGLKVRSDSNNFELSLTETKEGAICVKAPSPTVNEVE